MGNMCSNHPKTVEKSKHKILLIKEKNISKPNKTLDSKTEIKNFNINININDKTEETITAKNISEYIKGQFIGSTLISSVYSGLSLNTGEIVAIKSVKLNSQKQAEEIKKEVYKLSQLKNKNIIKYITTQQTQEDEIDIILEYCNGGSIKQLLEKFDSFDEKLIKLYVKQILEGLVYLHDQGIVHGNIRNCNVLVDGNGIVKLSDFIVSIPSDDSLDTILHFNTVKDYPYWMSPEVASKGNITTAVDIWSIGCIIIEMATRNPPWFNIAKTSEEVTELIINSKIPPKFPSHVSKECKAFLNNCLQKNPELRWSAKQLLDHDFFNEGNSICSPSSIRRCTLENIEATHFIQKENNNQIVNILADNSGAYFSITMTVYSHQQSIAPIEINKDKILNSHILEVDEPESSPKIQDDDGKKIDKSQFIFKNIYQTDGNCSIDEENFLKNLIDKKIDFHSLDKLNTLELNKDELNMIEKFFKDKNKNLLSLGDIENIDN